MNESIEDLAWCGCLHHQTHEVGLLRWSKGNEQIRRKREMTLLSFSLLFLHLTLLLFSLYALSSINHSELQIRGCYALIYKTMTIGWRRREKLKKCWSMMFLEIVIISRIRRFHSTLSCIYSVKYFLLHKLFSSSLQHLHMLYSL